MAHNQTIISDSDSTAQITKTIQDAIEKSSSSPVMDCDICCTKVLQMNPATTTTTTTEALVSSTVNPTQNLMHLNNNSGFDRPEPQTLQQAVVELVEVEEKKVFANEFFPITNSSEHLHIHNHFNEHPSHNNNGILSPTPNASMNSAIKRVPIKSHRQGHGPERPFGCHICGFAFSRNDHLVRHVNSHHKAKNFKCEICGKALSRRDHLKVHLRIHSGERPYKCTICGFAFSRHDHLVKHNQPNKGRRKLSCVPQPGFKTEPDTDLPLVTTPVAMTTESGEIVIGHAQIQAPAQQLIQQAPQQQTQVTSTQHSVPQVEVLNQQLVSSTPPTMVTNATDNNAATPTTLSLQTANTNGTIEIIAQPQQQQPIYQTISTPGGTNTVQVYPVTQIFPTTFQVSPTTAQIFPTTIQMNATTAQIIPLQMYPITTQIAAAPVYPKQ